MAIRGDFFAEKREWSKLKDQILNDYLTPYLAKILKTGRPTRIVDCFAGKGKFDDGTPGSPLFIARHIAEQHTRNQATDLRGIFIERKYVDDLRTNLAPFENCKVLPDDYEHFVQHFLSQPLNVERNYFFYVDPYGIKCLDFTYFKRLKAVGFKSLEILLNLNTTGFLREGCRMLHYTRELPDWATDLDYERDSKNNPTRMEAIAGGDYWQDILSVFDKGIIAFNEAEERFTGEYIRRLRSILPFVVNVPIKDRSYRLPKYRLIFATNHHAGLFLMTDTMNKAWHTLLTHESGGQLLLFNDEQWTDTSRPSIEAKIWDETAISTELPALLICLIDKHGIAHSTGDYCAAIRKHEGTMFQIQRNPDTTLTGRKARHLDYDRAHIFVKRLP
jgi:three-Cys-motif partner protein